MKKMWKRFVSLLLACTLLAGMLPLSASAQATAPGEGSLSEWVKSKISELSEEDYTQAGPFPLQGSDLYQYTFTKNQYDNEGNLTQDAVYIILPGIGAANTQIPDYGEDSSLKKPWGESNASAVYIAKGVTGIGNHAFDGMTTLETLEIENPTSLKSVGDYAFNGCDKLVGPLDLSGVTDMGKYAFNGCERLGSGENNKGVTLSDELTTIPENAFNTCGLKNVNIPTSCTEIGNNAFANNSLSQITELALPERLQKIGDNAFSLTMGEGNTSSGITSLTIPSSVESIGANAFSGRRNLQTVTVEDDKQDGTELILGDGAFGKNEFTAYSEQGSITDAAGTTYHGLLGTTFYLPADLVTTFRNGENCFTGDISPMEYVNTVPPTCTTNGYHIYKTTISGAISGEGQPVVVTYHVPLQMLGHDLDDGTPVLASCETGSYTLYKCQRENCSYTESQNIQDDATDHKYTIQSVSNLAMGNGTETVFTWECQQDGHSQERDGKPGDVSITVNPPAISADTTMTVGDLKMPEVDGGTLTLEASENPDEELTTDVTSVKVVFTPDNVKYAGYTGMGAVSGFGGVELTLKVDVNKAELDFSDVNFGNTRVFVDSTASEGTPITVYRGSLPEDVTYGPPLYSNDTGHNENTPPPRNSTWSGTVSVTFIYDPDKYEVDAEKKPGVDYTFDAGTPGQVTITHSYVIVEQSMDDLAAAPISPLTYKANTPQDTVLLSGVPYSSTVSWTWEEVGNQSNNGQGTETSPSDRNAMDIAPITGAGTYRVTITVEKDGFTSKTLDPITVTIAKATVTTPTAASDLQYTGKVQTGLQDPAPDALYKYVEGSQLTGTNAGPYTATAQLNDSENYRWSTGDDNGDGKVQISWNIAKRRVIETSIGTNYKSVPYIGNAYTAVGEPPRPSGLFTVTYREDGTLVGTLKETHAEAFTITNAQQTNAGTYEVIATITDFDNFYWQNHSEVKSYSLGTWTINRQQINAPTITAENATYTGEAYAGKVTLEHSEASDSRGSSQDIIDLDDTNIRYYTQQTGGNGGDAPVNAGTYFAGVESNGWAFVDGKVETNYQILGGARDPFSITKATAKMTFDQKEVKETYTAQGTDLQPVTVTGLVDADKDNPASEVYNVTYTYKYRENDSTDWEDVSETTTIEDLDTFVFMDVGQYQITAKWGAGTVSNNYTATDATYTLTIKKAEDQSITLTPDKEERWTEAIDQTPAKYTITYGEAATFAVIGKAALDNADISYEVKDGSDVVSVDSGNGTVTIHQAGMATITVTAAETPNVGADSVDYTVTVEKATPTVNTNLTDDELTVAYTGKAIEGYDEAEATAANVVAEAKQPTGDITYTFYTDPECSDENKVTDGGGKDGNIPIAVGTYYMKATYPGDKNYTSAESEPVTVTVTKAQLTVDAEGYEGTYEGETHSAITIKSVTGNGTTLAQGQYTVKYAKTNTNIAPGADADVWQNTLITVKDVADSTSGSQYYWYKVQDTAGNYEPKIEQVNVSITPAALKPNNVPDSYSKTYDGDDGVETDLNGITVTGIATEPISVTATGTYDNKNAGEDKTVTLTLSLSGTDGTEIDWGNYSYGGKALTEGEITLTKAGAGTITPKEITVTGISAVDRVYDGTKVVQLTGEPKTTDKVGEDNLTLALASNATGSIESADVGNDKAVTVETSVITLGGTDANNYKVSAVKDAANGDVKVNITQRPVNLEFAGIGQDDRIIEKAYTGQPVNVTVGPVNDSQPNTGFVKGDTLNAGDVVYTYSPEGHTAVGSYTVTAALKENPTGNYDNYQLNFPEKATLKITPAEMVVTAEDYTSTYTGKAHDVTASWTAKTTDGDQPITITGVQFIKKDEQHNTTPEADAEGWAEISFTNVAQSGKYWYKVTAENYSPMVGDDAVTITINPATLTINRAVTPTKTYDGTVDATNQVTGYSASGVDGETIEITNVSASYDDANAGTGKTITITYTLSTKANLGNYKYGSATLSGTNATVTETVTKIDETQVGIAPAEITVTIKDQQKVYDGVTVSGISNPEQDKDWSTTGTIYSQNGTNKDDLDITLTVDDAKKAGTYAITGTASNQNYEVTFTGSWTGEDANNGHAGTYTISPRPIDVQIGNAEGFYGDAPVLTGVGLTYEANDDNRGLAPDEEMVPGIKLGTGANEQSPVAVVGYTIYAVNDDNQVALNTPTVIGNYKVTFTKNGTYTVNPRPITITIEDHSSVYGEEINGGITTPVSGVDYTVAITNNATTGEAIVKGDNLEIKLTTEATADSPVDDYDITGSAAGEKVNNYAITWAGNGGDRDDGGKNGKYTIKPAQLEIAFTQGNQVTNGVSINIQDSYNDNSLVLENASTNVAVSEADKATLDITYSIGAAGGGAGGVSQIAEIDETTGEVTILKTGTVRITATVTPQGNSNYTGQVTTWYELNIISGGQITLTVTKNADLVYNGSAQKLLQSVSCSLDGADLQYKVDDGKWTENEPTGTNAGNYTVYVKATDPSGQYSDVTEHVMVTIDKATLEGSFAQKEYTHVLTTGTSYDSANKNPLTITSQNYKANPANYTYYSDNMKVASSANGTSTIVITGTAGQTATIRVTVPGDDNYNGKTFTYTLEISEKLSEIKYSVENDKVTYNGQPQTIAVNVTAPASGATVRYWNESTNAYDQTEPPAYTDVQDSGTTIKFQITAPGYNTVTGEATLTINPKPIKENMIAGIAESYTYTGKGITFDDAISVHDEGVLLEKDKDYTITYGDNKEVGQGTVTITGMGNYKESVTKNFTISPVDASDLTASLDRTFGYYGDSNTNNATVTVTHGSHEVNEQSGDTVSVTVTQFNGATANGEATVSGQTVTFNQVGTYTIEVTVTGNHATNAPIQLTYALLPVEKGELVLEADNKTSIVATYGDTVDGAITVTDANGTPMTENTDYTLTCTYTPFEGTAQGSKPYDPSVMSGTPAAGMYVVTATGRGGYANSVGTFTFLILQRDLADAILDVDDADLVFNHDEKRPSVTVTVDGNAQPTKDTDYTVTYYNNVNASKEAKAVVTATGNNFTGSKTEDFTIAPKPITAEMVDDIPDQHYTGSAVIPPVTITDGNYTLILGYDYTTACEDKGPGAATVTITGTGNYTGEVENTFTIQSEGAPEPSERFDLAVTPNQWTWEDDLTGLDLSVTFGEGTTLTLGTNYTLNVKGGEVDQNFTGGADEGSPVDFIKSLKPGTYTITATGTNAYKDSKDTETVTVKKIQPELTVTAAPETLSGGGKVTLTLKGEKLPDGTDLKNLLKVTAKNDSDVTLEDLHIQWPEDGSLTAELTLPNTNETYTFALRFAGNEYYEPASSNAMVVVGQQTSGGGGGSDPGDQPADPDDTGVSDWLNTKDHLAYLAGYPGGTFGPDQNMTRAEAAQMFYNLLLEKDVKITVEFEDVPADAWYAKPVNTLASLGILSGVGNGRFDPERSITRAEFTVIAMKFANTSGGGVNIFSDVNEDDWFYSAVVDSTQYGWINGYPDGTFRPEATISRAEVTVIVNHMLGRAADRPYVIAHEKELNTFGDVNRGHWGYFHIAEATNAHEYHTEDGTESWTGLS